MWDFSECVIVIVSLSLSLYPFPDGGKSCALSKNMVKTPLTTVRTARLRTLSSDFTAPITQREDARTLRIGLRKLRSRVKHEVRR